MLDSRVRVLLAPPLHRAATVLVEVGVGASQVTLVGWGVGVGACFAVAAGWWGLALALWLGNRVLDGLDGAVARIVGPTETGGFLDLVADFSVYAGFVLAVAVAVPDARLACVALLTAYYLSGTAFLALSSLLEKQRLVYGDGRAFRFVGGLAEGTETVLVYALLTLVPQHAPSIIWGFAAAVAVTAGQRIHLATRLLTAPPRVAGRSPRLTP